jgi:hypothetical protein
MNPLAKPDHSRGDPLWSPNTHQPKKKLIKCYKGECSKEWQG